jgi:adenosine deaminase
MWHMPSREELLRMPKVELHVHLEGSIRPETLLKLAKRHNASLPADDVFGLREWYRFRDFPHFVEVYVAISKCLRTPEDLELVAREFLEGQAEQNILHTEATFTASTIEKHVGIPVGDQMEALQSAMRYGRESLGVTMSLILDIVRGDPIERARQVAEWCLEYRDRGVCALGLAGEEHLGTKEYAPVFEFAKKEGLPVVTHAGETCGAEVVAECLIFAHACRIGHGVRCLEDAAVVNELRERQVPIEVCPSSNVCLGVFPSWEAHPLNRLLEEGLYVTLNSDDPPMFDTSLTDEYSRACATFGLNMDDCKTMVERAARASLLPETEKQTLIQKISS